MAEPSFIIRNSDGRVLHADAIEITSAGAAGSSWFDPTVTPTTTTMRARDAQTPAAAGVNWTFASNVWTAPPVDLNARRAEMRAVVNALRDAKLSGGYTHDFGSPHGEHLLQTRDADDRVNWLTSQAAYSAAVGGGQGAVMGATFRSASNDTITLSYAAGLGVLLAMAAWGAAVYGRSWQLKDAIDAAANVAALDSIDVNSGWPS